MALIKTETCLILNLLILALCHAVSVPSIKSMSCDSGFFRCNNSQSCIEQRSICDYKSDCEDHSDEWNCGDMSVINFLNNNYRKRPDEDREKKIFRCELFVKPSVCRCSRRSVFCENRGLLSIPGNFSQRTTEIDLSGNRFKHLDGFSFPDLSKLDKLILNTGTVQSFGWDAFKNLPNLRALFLTSNRLMGLENGTFLSLNKLRLLVISHNPLSILRKNTFLGLNSLIELDLRTCQISVLPVGLFNPLVNLELLWLQENFISELPPLVFVFLQRLHTLSLSRNAFGRFPTESLIDLPGLRTLSLAGNKLKKIDEEEILNLTSLESLDLQSNKIEIFHLKAFIYLPRIRSLNLMRNPFKVLPLGLFDGMNALFHLYMPEFSLCSYAPQVRVCEPKTDGISSRENLLDNLILRLSVWIVAIVAVLGNVFVLVGRLMVKEPNEVHSFYIKNLSVADLMIGVYLVVVGLQDCKFRGEYLRFDRAWRKSWQCRILGTINTLSSEATVLILAVITVDRFISITYPLALWRRISKNAVFSMAVVWVVAGLIAFLPWVGPPHFGYGLYGHNAVCLPLHIHEPFGVAWEYSLFIFCGLNTVAFLVIAIAYIKMFATIVTSRLGLRSSQQKLDRVIAMRFAFIVGADFMCWCPIIVIKFITMAGIQVDKSLYGWVAIFLLPVNAALNPVLYTLTSRLFKQQLARVVFTWRAPPLTPFPADNSSFSVKSADLTVLYEKGAHRLHITTISDSDSGCSKASNSRMLLSRKRRSESVMDHDYSSNYFY